MAKILLMDDDDDLTSVLKEVLEAADHSVTICRSGSEALAVIQAKKFDLLITDIIVVKDKKPVPDGGSSLISKLRGPLAWNMEPWMRKMPIIAISGAIHNQGMSNILKISRSLGADFALGKPTDIEELLHAVKTLTKKNA